MEISKDLQGDKLTVAIKGRLDTNAAPKLEEELSRSLAESISELVIDMADCDYVASSGLRVILGAQKKMNSLHGTMVVKNVVSEVMDVFEMIGFADILTFE